jgi:hypothetical protein
MTPNAVELGVIFIILFLTGEPITLLLGSWFGVSLVEVIGS